MKNASLLIIIIAIVLLQIMWLCVNLFDFPINYDGAVNYHKHVLLRIANHQHPYPLTYLGYYKWIEWHYRLFSVHPKYVYISQFIVYLCSLIGIYFLTKSFCGSTGGYLAVIFYSLHPRLLLYTRLIIKEPMIAFGVTCFLLLLFKALKKNNELFMSLAAGVGMLTTLFRQMFLPIPLICAAWLIFKKKVRLGLVLGTVYLCFFCPYLLHEYQGYSQALKKQAVIKQDPNSPIQFRHSVLERVFGVGGMWGYPCRKEWLTDGSKIYAPFSFFGISAFFLLVFHSLPLSFLVNKRNMRLDLLYIILLYWTLIHSITIVMPRHQISMLPIVAVIFAITTIRLREGWRDKVKNKQREDKKILKKRLELFKLFP